MYEVDEKDIVIELNDVPQSSVGAPFPIVLSDEDKILLAYLLENEPDWNTATFEDIKKPESVIVEFSSYLSFMFGVPNDEAFQGHPLANRGLLPYSAFEIRQSSWIRKLERMNSVHMHHNPKGYEKYKHFVFAFHDSTFECVAETFKISICEGSLPRVLAELKERLQSEW